MTEYRCPSEIELERKIDKMKLKTMEEIMTEENFSNWPETEPFATWLNNEVKELSIKHIQEALKKNKNMFKAWIYFMDIKEEDLTTSIKSSSVS